MLRWLRNTESFTQPSWSIHPGWCLQSNGRGGAYLCNLGFGQFYLGFMFDLRSLWVILSEPRQMDLPQEAQWMWWGGTMTTLTAMQELGFMVAAHPVVPQQMCFASLLLASIAVFTDVSLSWWGSLSCWSSSIYSSEFDLSSSSWWLW